LKAFLSQREVGKSIERISKLSFLAPAVSRHVGGISSNSASRRYFAINFTLLKFLLLICHLVIYKKEIDFSRLCVGEDVEDILPTGTMLPK
jgi:hypothetical protein